jgi:hypothetical protein
MFAASLMVCTMFAGNPTFPPSGCVILTDTFGPYETKQACKARVVEMAGNVGFAFKPPYNIKYKCEFLPST